MRAPVRRLSIVFFALCLILATTRSPRAIGADAERGQSRPKLFVLVVFDQMRGDYLIRWQPHFREGGFRRLLNDGAWFQNCHYPYAGTITGAGHASLLSGCTPSIHGIVANEWYVPATASSLNCVASLKHQRVPRIMSAASASEGRVSPENMQAPTFGDVLKDATRGEGRVVGLSLKDRSAALPAGKTPDACYWFDTAVGSFLTSTYYTEQVHPWVDKLNGDRLADKYFGKDWTRFRDDLDYAKLIGPDDVKGEGSGAKQGRTFPHAMDAGLKQPGTDFYKAIYNSPYGNEILLGLAKAAIDAEKLGADDVPDLLTVSFSSNDSVGHTWGPDSQEVFDITLRSDAIVKELLDYLDAKVGQGRYLVALSADHGVCAVPEVAGPRGTDAGRVSSTDLLKQANAFLEAQFGGSGIEQPKWIKAFGNGWFYLDQEKLKVADVTLKQASQVLCEWLRKQHGLSTAYTREQLEGTISPEDVIGQRVRLSYFPERCGDVVLVMRPHWLLGDNTTGTTHGSPFGYDSHVPLLIYGTSVKPAIRMDRVPPAAIAPIFSQALGVAPPAKSVTPLPAGVFSQAPPMSR